MRASHLLLFLFCFGSIAFPQDSTAVKTPIHEVKYDENSDRNALDFDDETIEDFKTNKAFDYTELETEENWWTRFKNWISDLWSDFWNWVFDGVEPGPLWASVIKILPYIILIAIVAFIIWLFFKLNPGASIFGKKKQPEVFFTEDEEIIKTKDIHKLIDKANRNKDYRLAVRYYYLLILQKASESEVIVYEFDKTNTDYIAEITSEDVNGQFVKVTDLYDHVWYGSFEVSEEDYKKAQKTFTTLEHRLMGIKPKSDE